LRDTDLECHVTFAQSLDEYSFIHSFIHSFVRSFVRLFIYSASNTCTAVG